MHGERASIADRIQLQTLAMLHHNSNTYANCCQLTQLCLFLITAVLTRCLNCALGKLVTNDALCTLAENHTLCTLLRIYQNVNQEFLGNTCL